MGNRHNGWQRFAAGWNSFMEKQGFLITIGACVAVIIGTAVYTGNQAAAVPVAPTLPPTGSKSVAQLMQESLAEAVQTQMPAPTATPAVFVKPLEAITVLQSFDDTLLKRSEITGIYRLHDAVDLAAAVGEPVRSMAEGVVVSVREKGIANACVVIGHADGMEITYAGMSALCGIRAGDRVDAGQTIGFAGPGPDDEMDMEPHVHLRVVRNGRAMDPMPLLTQ